MEINKDDMPKIDLAFRKAMLSPEESSDDGMALWEKSLARKVVQQNFFTFGFTTFNAFTASMVLSLAVFISGSVYYMSNTVNAPIPKAEGLPKTEVLGDSSVQVEKTLKNKTHDKNYLKKGSAINSIKVDSLKTIQVINGATDTAVVHVEKSQENGSNATLSNPQNLNDTKVRPVKILKKTILIEKQDTVETVDTIRSKKEWKKVSKNK